MKILDVCRRLIHCAMHDSSFARFHVFVARIRLLERGYILPCDDMIPPHCWVLNPSVLIFINPPPGWGWGFAPVFEFDLVRSSLLYQFYFVHLGFPATACPPPGYGDEEEW